MIIEKKACLKCVSLHGRFTWGCLLVLNLVYMIVLMKSHIC